MILAESSKTRKPFCLQCALITRYYVLHAGVLCFYSRLQPVCNTGFVMQSTLNLCV